MNAQCGLIVNNFRAIIFADGTKHFAQVAAEREHEVQQQMATLIAPILS